MTSFTAPRLAARSPAARGVRCFGTCGANIASCVTVSAMPNNPDPGELIERWAEVAEHWSNDRGDTSAFVMVRAGDALASALEQQVAETDRLRDALAGVSAYAWELRNSPDHETGAELLQLLGEWP